MQVIVDWHVSPPHFSYNAINLVLHLKIKFVVMLYRNDQMKQVLQYYNLAVILLASVATGKYQKKLKSAQKMCDI